MFLCHSTAFLSAFFEIFTFNRFLTFCVLLLKNSSLEKKTWKSFLKVNIWCSSFFFCFVRCMFPNKFSGQNVSLYETYHKPSLVSPKNLTLSFVLNFSFESVESQVRLECSSNNADLPGFKHLVSLFIKILFSILWKEREKLLCPCTISQLP